MIDNLKVMLKNSLNFFFFFNYFYLVLFVERIFITLSIIATLLHAKQGIEYTGGLTKFKSNSKIFNRNIWAAN